MYNDDALVQPRLAAPTMRLRVHHHIIIPFLAAGLEAVDYRKREFREADIQMEWERKSLDWSNDDFSKFEYGLRDTWVVTKLAVNEVRGNL